MVYKRLEIQTHRYTTAGAERGHSPQILVRGLERDHQDGGISVTQIIACVDERNPPPLIRQTLDKAKQNSSVFLALQHCNVITCATRKSIVCSGSQI